MSESTTNLQIVRSPVVQQPTPAVLPMDLVDEVSLAGRLGVSRSTLQSWRYSSRGPRFIKVGRLIRYRNADVESYLAKNACDPAA